MKTCWTTWHNKEQHMGFHNLITHAVDTVRNDLGLTPTVCELGNMDSSRDWGHSYDYVRAMHKIVNHVFPEDWIVSTGKSHSVREMCDYVFSSLDMNYKDYVVQNPKYMRPEELKYLCGDSSNTRKVLNWEPTYTFETMLDEMIKHWYDYPLIKGLNF